MGRGAWQATVHGVAESDKAERLTLSLLGHHRALSSVPCAIEQVLVSYLFYTQYQYAMQLSIPISQFIICPVFSLVSIGLFSMSMSLFLLCKLV